MNQFHCPPGAPFLHCVVSNISHQWRDTVVETNIILLSSASVQKARLVSGFRTLVRSGRRGGAGTNHGRVPVDLRLGLAIHCATNIPALLEQDERIPNETLYPQVKFDDSRKSVLAGPEIPQP
ncbi:hypothetical protein PoB_001509800 [Plakobranchus ocellatus]|uniref:Uncharacterized protein n=1 Tax=Plakobranchus ocellatus TaxID=259542 RepID=A0AAV3Z1E3_9GAST|nr:hypothetical protein PoB_001509800 [Plakobranchus ocellatus]